MVKISQLKESNWQSEFKNIIQIYTVCKKTTEKYKITGRLRTNDRL